MDKDELISKIVEKKEFSDLPRKDVEVIFDKFDKKDYADEDKIKLTRDLLRKVYSVFASGKLLNKNIIDKKSAEEILKKHISTKERYEFYAKLYEKLFGYSGGKKEISIFDFGAGINGLSYGFFPKDKTVNYFGIEAVGQLVDLMNYFFKKENLNKRAKAIHESLFDIQNLKSTIKSSGGFKILFLFKVLDSLEMVERDYSKKLLNEIVPLSDLTVVSFATRSLVSRKKFRVERSWFLKFIEQNFEIVDNFELGSERYVVFRNPKKE